MTVKEIRECASDLTLHASRLERYMEIEPIVEGETVTMIEEAVANMRMANYIIKGLLDKCHIDIV